MEDAEAHCVGLEVALSEELVSDVFCDKGG